MNSSKLKRAIKSCREVCKFPEMLAMTKREVLSSFLRLDDNMKPKKRLLFQRMWEESKNLKHLGKQACFPFMDTTVQMPCSPFDTWFKQNSTANKDFIDENGDQQYSQYFCELCGKNCVEIQSHLGTAEHKNAAMDDAHYTGVDALIKKGVSVEHFLKMIKEKHSSFPNPMIGFMGILIKRKKPFLRIVGEWNSLPLDIREASSVKDFELKLLKGVEIGDQQGHIGSRRKDDTQGRNMTKLNY
ncbi:hypothetical protein P5673_013705 [Acropora cervicornis]|uniref:DBF4-type domain-containing protein n=1 Tax=Acropora cervicornis TaxID=6130 RepID=A0AAD9QKB2_ACRCE|nr:hypothetical protein P5673_013705 [Acropora cervicornis]